MAQQTKRAVKRCETHHKWFGSEWLILSLNRSSKFTIVVSPPNDRRCIGRIIQATCPTPPLLTEAHFQKRIITWSIGVFIRPKPITMSRLRQRTTTNSPYTSHEKAMPGPVWPLSANGCGPHIVHLQMPFHQDDSTSETCDEMREVTQCHANSIICTFTALSMKKGQPRWLTLL